MTQTAYRFYKDQRVELTPVANPATSSWSPKLVFAPGYYRYNDLTYDLTQPGFYLFYAPGVNTTHMVVYGGDPIALLTGAAWLSTFGKGDQGLTFAQMSAKARTSVLCLLCGYLNPWCKQELLDPAGVAARIAYFVTCDTPDNSVDGHQALEVTIGGAKVLVDLSNKTLFLDAAGQRLSARDAVSAIAAGTWSYEPLALANYATEPASGFDATGYAMTKLATETDRRVWHGRIINAVGMDHNGEVWWKLPPGADGRKTWLESQSPAWKVKDAGTWDATYY
jgi:hypothetical protein